MSTADAKLSCIRLFWRLGIWLIAFLATVAPSTGAQVPRSVLIIHQWESNLPWYEDFSSALNDGLHAGSPEVVTLFAEYMDLGRFKSPAHHETLHRYIIEKYQDREFGIILAVGSSALEFALGMRAEMWPETPVVFAAVAEPTVADLNLAGDITGSIVDPSLRDMVTTARALVPNLKRIALLGDPWDDKSAYRKFKQELPAVTAELEVIDLTGLSLAEIRWRVAVLPEQTAILYTAVSVDGAGIAYVPHDVLASVAEVANQPIVIQAESQVGHGAVGGIVFSPELVGADAAQRVVRILRGESASNIPLARSGFTKAVFDWRQLQRWNISESRLPPESEVRFRQAGMWELQPWQLSALSLIVAFQIVLTAGWLLERRRRGVAESNSRRHLGEVAHLNRSAAVGALSASLGHELNQPLGAVLNNAEAAELLLNADPPDVEKVKAILADIRRDDLRAAEVIRRFRGLTKKGESEPQLIDVNDVVRVMTDILAAEAASRGVMLSAELDQRQLPARADPVHLQQVVLNLALNGMDAMLNRPAGARHMTVQTILVDGSTIKVAVSDSGAGIPSEKLKDIFEPFFTTKRQGMGLGLSIARTIIEQSGGKIWGENRPEGGAVFSFTLPLARERPA